MNSIEQLGGELQAIDVVVSQHLVRLERERGHMVETMEMAQGTFGDQKKGQSLVAILYYTLTSIVNADSAIYSLKIGIHNYIQQIQK